VADNILFPNGMVVTPGNDTLIVADSFAKQLVAFDITVDGSLSGRRVWAAMDDGPDGICLDPSGAVWAGSMNNCVRIREGGEVLQTVPSDRFCFSCALGGDDGKTLFIMAAEWPGVENWSPDLRTGQVQIAQV
jgi:sugar lactone lactonase YvrE